MESGTKLGHYEISTLLGKGGMGEVWKAKDTKLGREVAIKTLPEEFAKDADRLARFEREAKLLASLNHPNIAAIHGFEEDNGTHFLVLELVEGDTLADRLNRGAIPIEESLKLALQIADALKAAHDSGVIHRDLKPLNIKLTDDDTVKVLDFGLAKAFAGDEAEASVSNSPTLSMAATQQGVILGTAAYMSPEQAKGRTVDKRTDIWAFGCVLYEMLTGRQSFGASDVTESLAAVIRSEPQWDTLPTNLHPRLRETVGRCLDKQVAKRFQDIGDVSVDIEKVLADPSGVLVQPVAEVFQAAPQSKLRWVATVVLGIVVAGLAGWNLRPLETLSIMHFDHELADGLAFGASRTNVAVSPEGDYFVYNTSEGLYLRSMDELEAGQIPGADTNVRNPVISPDGQWLAYWVAGPNQLRKIGISGGAPVVLCDASNPFGMSWSAEDDTIVYGQPDGIWQVSADGGTPELIVPIQDGEQVGGPQVLPGGEWVLFTATTSVGASRWEEAEIVVQSLESQERLELVQGADARYVPTGHLIYALGDDLFATSFDLGRLEVTGGPVPLIEEIRRERDPGQTTGTANFSISDRGLLVYAEGGGGTTPSALGFVDRNGIVELLDIPASSYVHPRLSPDGGRLAVESDGEIWVHDLYGETQILQLTQGANNSRPIWTPDGESLTFASTRDGSMSLYVQRADGAGSASRLTTADERDFHWPGSWSPDGILAFTVTSVARTYADIWTLSLDEGADQNSSMVFQIRFSPIHCSRRTGDG